MVDELDLLRDLKTAEPVRASAFEQARAELGVAMATQEAPKPQTASRRWSMRCRAGFGIGVLVAMAAATALVVTSLSAPTDTAPANTTKDAAGNPILVRLAADLTPLRAKEGDATLEIRNQSPTSDALGRNGIGLFTDDGTYYWANDKAALRRIVSKREGGDDVFKRSIAVALYAVKGDLNTARARMAVSNLAPGTDPDASMDAAEKDKIERLKRDAKERGVEFVPPKPLTPEQLKERTDNHIWTNSIDALIAAPENPQVRAGVLRIMATMPNAKVTKTTTAGRPTLTVSDTWSIGGKYTETLVIDAKTGQPVALTSIPQNEPSRTTYYHNTRVKIADIEAGRF